MNKPTRRKTSGKKTAHAKRAKRQLHKADIRPDNEGKLSFDHGMVYVKDVERGLSFYRDLLGFKLIEDFRYEKKPVYAHLRAPGGEGTIALHQAGPGLPFRATAYASTSKCVNSMTSAAIYSKRASISPNCHA